MQREWYLGAMDPTDWPERLPRKVQVGDVLVTGGLYLEVLATQLEQSGEWMLTLRPRVRPETAWPRRKRA
jgi:hypothetical protein